MAIIVLLCLLVLAVVLPEQRNSAVALFGGGLAVSAIGTLDDRYGLGVKLRLLVQVVAAIWVIVWVGGSGGLSMGQRAIPLHWLGTVAAVFYIVWCTNLYNFMDGIDGIAASQAVVAGTVAAGIFAQRQDNLLAITMLVTASAAAGFLAWNWPPARIFMGDCGSCLLGFIFGCVAVVGQQHGSLPASAGLMLILVFVVDASLTLLRRMLKQEPWYRPHRTHAYQLAVQMGANHRQVTLVAMVLFLSSAALAIYIALDGKFALWGSAIFSLALVLFWTLINRLSAGRSAVLL